VRNSDDPGEPTRDETLQDVHQSKLREQKGLGKEEEGQIIGGEGG
jgi:hypothetical protein